MVSRRAAPPPERVQLINVSESALWQNGEEIEVIVGAAYDSRSTGWLKMPTEETETLAAPTPVQHNNSFAGVLEQYSSQQPKHTCRQLKDERGVVDIGAQHIRIGAAAADR